MAGYLMEVLLNRVDIKNRSYNNFVGQANNTTINGGRQSIHDGGISTDRIESGNQDVYTGGISNGTTIKGGNSHISGGLRMEQSLMVAANE